MAVDNFTAEEKKVRAKYEELGRQIKLLEKKQDALPRCNNQKPNGAEVCFRHLGHSGDHSYALWNWPNYGPSGKGPRR
jgi:hypothetical protein